MEMISLRQFWHWFWDQQVLTHFPALLRQRGHAREGKECELRSAGSTRRECGRRSAYDGGGLWCLDGKTVWLDCCAGAGGVAFAVLALDLEGVSGGCNVWVLWYRCRMRVVLRGDN